MTHKSILDNFSFRFLSKILEEEMGRLVFTAKCDRDLNSPKKELNFILNALMSRWNIMFLSIDFTDHYKYVTFLTIAIYLNKYGYQDENITRKAIDGLIKLKNDDFGILPSHQYKKIEKTIELLESSVDYHTKKPTYGITVTQYRQGDIFSIKFKDYYRVGIVNEVIDYYEALSVFTYDQIFENEPITQDIKNVEFMEDVYRIPNLNYLPDPAGQFKLIGTIKWEKVKSSRIGADIYEYLSGIKK